jgi:hypothetical protein
MHSGFEVTAKMRAAILLCAWFLVQGQTQTPGEASQQWFAQHLPVPAPSTAHTHAPSVAPPGRVLNSLAPGPSVPGPLSHVLTACAAGEQIIPLYEFLARTESVPALRRFDASLAEKTRSDLSEKSC